MTSSDFLDEQNRPCLIQKIEPTYLPRLGEPLELNLGSYGIDLPIRDGKYLIPLQTVSDIFVAPIFLDCIYFNGKSVIIASDFCVTQTVTTHLMKKIRLVTENCSVSLPLPVFHAETSFQVPLGNPKKLLCSEEHLPVVPA